MTPFFMRRQTCRGRVSEGSESDPRVVTGSAIVLKPRCGPAGTRRRGDDRSSRPPYPYLSYRVRARQEEAARPPRKSIPAMPYPHTSPISPTSTNRDPYGDYSYITPGRASGRRASSYVPYGEYDDDYYHDADRRGSRSLASYSPPRRRGEPPIAEEEDDGGGYHPRRRDSPPRRRRASPVQEEDNGNEDEDGDWETEYNPRDRFYLSHNGDDDGDDDSDRLGLGGLKRDKSRSYRNDNTPAHPSSNCSSSRRPESSSRRDSNYYHQTPERRHNSASSSYASPRPRPHPHPRSFSSSSTYGHGKESRPMHSSRPSGSRGKRSSSSSSSSRRPPRSSSSASSSGRPAQSPPSFAGSIPWKQAAKAAARSGAIAAIRMSGQEGDWIGAKGTKVATAALGAALVDTFMDHKLPHCKGGMRHKTFKHVTQTVLGNLLVAPTMEKGQQVRKKRAGEGKGGG